MGRKAVSRSKRTPLGADPSTIRNPNARPRAGSLAPATRALPEVVDHRGDCPHCGCRHVVRLAIQRGEEYSEDNIAAWTIWYRSEYESGHVDEVCRFQKVIAATQAKAIETLRQLQFGVAVKLHLFEVERPPTAAEVRMMRHRDTESPGNDEVQREGTFAGV
ncbi:MAG: hypothetical protein ABFE13_24820 [Phycisphaerales bacterium]